MACLTFAALKLELDEACAFLRQFTLGKRGFTQRDGLATIQRVSDLCDQLKADFGSGADATAAVTAVAAGRTRIVAAQTRLALLKGKR